MFFTKPKIKYTDMAIYIDDHIYNEDYDPNLVYQYLYHLINMLAYKSALFKTAKDYENFSLESATQVYFRLTNKKQFILDESGKPKMKRIKSVLNFLKKTLYFMKVDYEQKAYTQLPEPDECETEYNMRDALLETVDELQVTDFAISLHDVCRTVKAYLKDIPYKSNPAVWQNIYLSCLLSLLSSITLSNKNKERVEKADGNIQPELLYKFYMQERSNQVVLYNLDDSMRDYINILTNSIRHMIAKDLSSCLHSYVPSDVGIHNLINSASQEDYQRNE